jgi:hypothetical protein
VAAARFERPNAERFGPFRTSNFRRARWALIDKKKPRVAGQKCAQGYARGDVQGRLNPAGKYVSVEHVESGHGARRYHRGKLVRDDDLVCIQSEKHIRFVYIPPAHAPRR